MDVGGLVGVILLAAAALALVLVIVRRRGKLHVDLIPFSSLGTEESVVLGRSGLGLVLKGK